MEGVQWTEGVLGRGVVERGCSGERAQWIWGVLERGCRGEEVYWRGGLVERRCSREV